MAPDAAAVCVPALNIQIQAMNGAAENPSEFRRLPLSFASIRSFHFSIGFVVNLCAPMLDGYQRLLSQMPAEN